MKTKSQKKFLLILLSLLLISVAGFILNIKTNDPVFAAEVIIDNWEQANGAMLGDILEVPGNVKLKIDDNIFVDAEEGIIISPDGNARVLEPKRLNMTGKYRLQYQTIVNGKTYKGEKDFVVSDSNYYLSSNYSSTAEFVSKDNLKYGKYLYNQKADGIEVLLSKGDSFRFNQPVNIYDAANSEGMVDVTWAYPVMDTSLWSTELTLDANGDPIYEKDNKGNLILDSDGNPIPRGKYGSNKQIYFSIKLIDCYDESNYVEYFVYSWQEGELKHTGCAVGASNQTCSTVMIGTGASATVEIGGRTYIPHYYDRYSPVADYWIYSNTFSLFSSGVKKAFSMNVKTNEVYFNNSLITDLDHPQIYPNNAFKGFTTGEVYVEYSFNNYKTNDSAYLYIKEILGLSGDQLKKALVNDNKCPDVNIDIEYTNEAEKSINIVYNREFTLPKADVYDVNGKGSYKLAVYYDYDSDNPKSVNIKDGKFIPDKLGVVYTAVYLVEDKFGNNNIDANGKCLDVLNMKPVTEESISYEEKKVETLIGCKNNYIPVIDANTFNKNLVVKVYVVEPSGQRVDVTDSFDGLNYTVIPEYIGEYTIEYVMKDNVYSRVFSYNINCVDDGVVLFSEKIVLPSIFIKDAIYDLDEYFVYTATSEGLNKNRAKLLVSADGNSFNEIADIHKFKVEGENSLSFKAEFMGKESPVQTCKITDVNYKLDSNINGGMKIYENYFVGFDNVRSTSSYIEYDFDTTKPVCLQYATPLVFDAFSIEFEIPALTANNTDKISLILKEISGKDKGLIVSYTKLPEETQSYFTITDLSGKISYYAKVVNGPFSGIHSLTVSDSKLISGEGVIVEIADVNSRNIELSMTMNKISAPVSFRVMSLCGNAFNGEMYEKPASLVYKRQIGNAEVGEDYVLPMFNISSVFYPISLRNLSYSFKDGLGNVLVDKDNNKIENVSGDSPAITIVPERVGIYYFEFSYNNYGKRLKVIDPGSFIIAVIDTIAPTTTFNDGSNSDTVVNVKVGETHKIKEFTVVDNYSEGTDLNIKVVVIDEHSAVIGWNVGNSFEFTKAGRYKIVVFAQDAERNTSRTYYNVSVQ